MKHRWFPTVLVFLLVVIAGCGDGSTSSAPDPADATSCADLADKYVEIAQELLDSMGELTTADMESAPADVEAAADEWYAVYKDLVPRVGELCGADEFDALLCDRIGDVEAFGEEGERFLNENYPGCSQEPAERTTLPKED